MVRLRALVFALLLVPSGAWAFEGRLALGPEVSGGFVGAPFANGSSGSGGVGASLVYGLSDTFDLVADGGWALYDLGGAAHLARLSAGIAYVVDVLSVVPHLSVSAGGMLVARPDAPLRMAPTVEVALGADYLVSRSWAIGLVVRGTYVFGGDADVLGQGQTMLLTLAARLLWTTEP